MRRGGVEPPQPSATALQAAFLTYGPTRNGGGIRTHDLRLMRPASTTELLYPVAPVEGFEPPTCRSVAGRTVRCATREFPQQASNLQPSG